MDPIALYHSIPPGYNLEVFFMTFLKYMSPLIR